jgi:hypothetical protein
MTRFANGSNRLVPVTIIDDGRHRAAGRIPKTPQMPNEAASTLPLIYFPRCTIVDAGVDVVEFKATDSKRPPPGKLNAVSLEQGMLYAIGGIIGVEKQSEAKFAPVVLQIVDERKTGNGEKLIVIVDEDFAEPERTETGFQYAKTLTCPRVEGRYLLRSFYRGSKVGELPVEVKLNADPK